MQPAAGEQTGPRSLELLAAAMCRAQGPSQALLVAANQMILLLPSMSFVGLAVGAQDKQSVRYSTLLSTKQGAARLGAVAASSCAAGIAIDTKQVVHVRDLANGDLGLHDLQYLQQVHKASACLVVPLVVAQNALGALSLAATQVDAFSGHESWLQVVAAMCSPYVLLLKSHEGLLALEGLVSQVMPMRVALQLQDQQRRSSLTMPPGAAQQQQLPLPGGTRTGSAAGASTPVAGAPAGNPTSGVQGQATTAAAGPEGDASGGSLSLRQLRAAQRMRQQQRAAGPQHAAQAGVPIQAPQHQPQQLQHVAEWGWAFKGAFAFRQPRLEQAYQRWALQQWVRLLDTLFLLLVLLSAFGANLRQAFSMLRSLQHQHWWRLLQIQPQDVHLCAGLSVVLALTVCWVLFSLSGQQQAGYLRRRKPCMAVVRVVRTLLFCCEVWHLKPAPGSGARVISTGAVTVSATTGIGASAGRLLAGLSSTTAASCGLLMMLGLVGQLPSPLHAAVQAVCLCFLAITQLAVSYPRMVVVHFAGVSSMSEWVLSVLKEGLPAGLFNAACLVVFGFVLPVVLVAAVEWGSRRHFLRKIS